MRPFLLSVLCLLATSTAKTLYKSPGGSVTSLPVYKNVIPVRYGNSSVADCIKSGFPKTDLNESLKEAFRYKKSVQLQLSEGCFIVTSNDLATFSGWTDFAIVGKGVGTSTISCDEDVGFSFLSSTGIAFRNVSITGCSRVQNSTSKNFSTDAWASERLSFVQFWVGVYFLSCSDITMDHVNVSRTNGVGVVMYNCNGTNTFNYSTFELNYREGDELFRGGNVAVEFSYCLPGDINCKSDESPSFQVTQSTYTFYRCEFQYILYSSDKSTHPYNVPIVPYPHGTEHMAFGKGGGLSVIFKGRSSRNSIIIDTCTFHDNSAQWGGGLYTSFADQSTDNTVTVVQSHFYMNENPCSGNSRKWHQSGGAAQIDFFYYPPDDDLWPGYRPSVLRNNVSFYRTTFATNMACWGGAVSIVVSRETPGQPVTNSVLFDGCQFNYNLASIAMAIDVSVLQPDLITSNGLLMAPVLKDCQFIQNVPTFTDSTNFQVATSTGVVFANLGPLNFTGHNEFSHNGGTALVVSGTYVTVSESSILTFDSNVGRHGGAVAFIGNSWLVAHSNAQVTFVNNSAETLGGAIYSVHFGEHDLMYKQNCFFQYYKATVHPSNWNINITFSKNRVKNKPNSIYTTSLLPCIWPESSSRALNISDTFCGHPWVFDNNSSCTTEISTGPSDLCLRENVISIKAVPGWRTEIPVTALNDYDHKIQTVFTAAPLTSGDGSKIGVNNLTKYIADNEIIVRGVNKSSANLLLRTLDPKVISSQLGVEILNCPPGYTPQNCSDDPSMVCDCICTYGFYGVGCHNESHYIKVYRYNCLTHWHEGNGTDFVSGRCPYHQNITIFESFTNFSENRICGRMNRQGTLCSKCKSGYGVSVNSYSFACVKCDESYSWLLYILAELVPIIIFFIIVAFFNISAASGPMNAFVFFSQIVTVPYFHNPHTFTFGILFFNNTQSRILEAFIAFPYSIWNLDFFTTSLIPGFCLNQKLTTLDVIGLKYLIAFLPLLLIAICYILIELHGRNYRSIRCMWRPFRSCLKKIYKNREPKTSIIDAFATFLLLSYSKVLFISFSLFAPNYLHDASGRRDEVYFYFDASQKMFSGKHAVLVIVAIVIFVLYMILPPVILILYPMRCFQRIIDKLPFRIALRTFADAFNGDFRDGTYKDGRRGDGDCRRYAGYYFLLRVIMLSVYVSERSWLDQFFIQQILFSIAIVLFAAVRPYKVDFYNKLDTAFFLLLSIMNAFSSYNSRLFYEDNRISKPVFWINYLLAFLPLVYITGYCVYLILLWKGCLKRWAKVESPVSESVMIINDTNSIEDNDISEIYINNSEEDIPDRLVNPQNYNSRNLYKPHNENATALLRPPTQERPRQGSSEKSYFHARPRRDPQLVPYGSFNTSERHTEPILRPSSLSKAAPRRSKGSTTADNSGTKSTNSGSSKGSSVRFQGVV